MTRNPAEPESGASIEPAASHMTGERCGGLGPFAWGFLALLWLYAIYRLGTLWHSNEDYAFGWFIPLLCLCLFWERWKARPRRSPVRAASGTFLVLGLAALALWPAALALEVMPLMRLAGWTFALAIVAISLIVLYFAGGKSWCRHFAFPVFFFLIAVPWPSRLEVPLVDTLSEWNAASSTLIVNLLGTPAIRRGVLIETGPGLVGVDEACSGIRSFQASVMVGLFLGELFRHGFLRRLLLLLGGVGIAFACNVIRTSYLVRACDLNGTAAVNVYHDMAGFTILGITFAGLLLLAWWMRLRGSHEPGEETAGEAAFLNPVATEDGYPPPPVTPVARLKGALASLAVWLVVLEAGIELWFSSFEQQTATGPAWQLKLPAQNREFRQVAIPKTVKDILHFDEAMQAEWRDRQDHTCQFYYLRWNAPRNRYQAIRVTAQARGHAADVCLRNAGMTLTRELGTELTALNGVRLEIKAQRFLSQGRPFHVFTCYWDPHVAEFSAPGSRGSSWRRTFSKAIALVKARNRLQVEKRVIKLGIWGVDDDDAAQVAARESLAAMILAPAQTPSAPVAK